MIVFLTRGRTQDSLYKGPITYDFAKFSEKLHEIGNIFGRGGGGGGMRRGHPLGFAIAYVYLV